MIGFTFDRDKQEIWLYYDGRNVAIYSLVDIDRINVADSIIIGGIPAGPLGGIHTFNGLVDEVMISGTRLSADSILRYYSTYVSPKHTEENSALPSELKVAVFNIWYGGRQTGKTIGVRRVVDILKKERADIICLIETNGSGQEIADALGYYFYLRCFIYSGGEASTMSGNLSILSRYPIVETVNVFKPFHSSGSVIQISTERQVVVMNNWLSTAPGRTYQLQTRKIPEIEIADFIQDNSYRRKKELWSILDEIAAYAQNTSERPSSSQVISIVVPTWIGLRRQQAATLAM